MNIDQLKFDEKGLIPAIVINAETKKVLMLAYMSRRSLEISLEKKAHLLLQPLARGTLDEGRDQR